ncbi:MAG: SAM-dependent methyltransferase [Clostridia bacterium]|nr:SAM-dependent methyltransferase [Clostridia bacterium]
MHIDINDTYIKKKCQIFTPEEQVNQMLDAADYSNDIVGKKVLENSCGSGRILKQIVRTYIQCSQRRRLSRDKIKEGLENDIFAYELDKNLIRKCKRNLNEIAEEYNIFGVKWNIKCRDFLAVKKMVSFDYIIGNPPYIAYHDLELGVRKYVKENYETCKKGKFDYSYAFIEKSYKNLSQGGKLTYIIPSNIFKNVFAKELRDLVKMDTISIIDFPDEMIFEKVLVSPAIITIEKGANTKYLYYSRNGKRMQIDKDTFEEKWVFSNNMNHTKKTGFRVGDYFQVSSTVATLLNKAFVLKNAKIENGYYMVQEHRLEEAIVKKATSPKTQKYKKNIEHIIFPYYYSENGGLCKYNIEDFETRFPGAMEYLNEFIEELEKRDVDSSAKWFEYGRSQALKNMNQPKIMISSIISDCTKAYLLDADTIPYSGLYIIPKKEKTLEELLPQLNSVAFKTYASAVGVCVSGTSKRINPGDIENFVVEYK